jgi:hypothetical protein
VTAVSASRAGLLRTRAFLRRDGTGLAVSALFHLLALALIVAFLRQPKVSEGISRVLSVDIVQLTLDKQPSANQRSPFNDSAPPRPGRAASLAPAGISRDEKKPLPQDAFDAKLRALAQLRQPDTKLTPLENAGSAEQSAGGAGGTLTGYSLRDFVRAQVLRHWNLDYGILGGRRFSVPVRVVMKSNGVIISSDIVDKSRYATDPVYHEIALSARNAVTLSSPIPLPPGNYRAVMSFVLDLDPRDTDR